MEALAHLGHSQPGAVLASGKRCAMPSLCLAHIRKESGGTALLIVAKAMIGLCVRYHARQRTQVTVGTLIEKARKVMPQPVVG